MFLPLMEEEKYSEREIAGFTLNVEGREAKLVLANFLSTPLVSKYLTLIQLGEGRFALTYIAPDYLHSSHTGLPSWIRVKYM